MAKIEEILDILQDAKVHSVRKIQRRTGLDAEKLKEALRFMAEFHLIMFDEATGSVAVAAPLRDLLTETQAS